MGLFEKKFCDICGEKIGLLGNRKVEDGNVCSKCVKKLSPFFTERRRSTVNDIKNQLAYREKNRQELNSFNATRTFGYRTKVYIDDSQQKFVVSRSSDYREANADIIALSQVSGVRYNVEEHRTELHRKDSEGRSVSYNPPRYEYRYEFTVVISVNSPYFDEIKFELSDQRPDSKYTEEYRRYEEEANQIVNALRGMNSGMGMGYAAGQYGQYQQPMQQGYPQQQFQQPMQQGYPQQQYQQPIQQGYPQQQYQQPVQQGYPQQQYQQPMQQGYPQQQYQQPMQQGYPQQQYQQPMQQGYSQQQYQQPMQQGYPQQQYQQPMQQDYPQQQYQQPMQQGYPQQQPVQQEAWTCPSCGASNTGKFCVGCGSPKQ